MTSEARKEKVAGHCRKILRWMTPVGIACLLLIGLMTSGLAGPARPGADTTLKIAPLTKKVRIGNATTTDVVVEDVANLFTFEVRLAFNPSKVEALKVEPGGFLSPDWQLQKTIDNENGQLVYAVSQLRPTEPVTGTGALATITWRGIATGTSPITFTHQELYHPGGGAPIPAQTQDGEIVVEEPLAHSNFLPLVIKQ